MSWKRGKAIAAQKAYEYVAGYMPLNDVSARAWQFADKQWVRGKSCDTFCPTGPYLVTRDEVADPHNLAICARVNGTVLQKSGSSPATAVGHCRWECQKVDPASEPA